MFPVADLLNLFSTTFCLRPIYRIQSDTTYPKLGDAYFKCALWTFEQQLALKMRVRYGISPINVFVLSISWNVWLLSCTVLILKNKLQFPVMGWGAISWKIIYVINIYISNYSMITICDEMTWWWCLLIVHIFHIYIDPKFLYFFSHTMSMWYPTQMWHFPAHLV